MRTPETPIHHVEAASYRIPTDGPESDGTYEWSATTLVVAHASAGAKRGVGYTYAARAAAVVVRDDLADAVRGIDAMDVPRAHHAMVRAVRNVGRPGIASTAISAVDAALWDLKAKLLGVPLVALLGEARDRAPVYGSGGFTSYSVDRLREQLVGWAREGMTRVKMKVGRDASADRERVRAVREALPRHVELFVDANGAYDRKLALAQAEAFADQGVTWFEEPVTSDDLEGLRLLRDRAPAGMRIAAGEYGFDPTYFRRMLDAGAVDVLQADASRCGGVTGLLGVDALCDARSIALSCHCAPQLHAHVACAARRLVHVEYFHDHARIERMLFDGALVPKEGALAPDRSRPGLGVELKTKDAAPYAL
jgi:L-alanine-DL-glutamate epimerase-like enolase superfamily enzyme